MQKAFSIRLIISIILIFLVYFVWFNQLDFKNFFTNSKCENGLLCVTYLDVGQGDSTFIESPSGVQMLIDGGPDGSVLRKLSKTMSFFDKSIDILLVTHTDQDHIAGLVNVLKRYDIGTVIITENKNETPVSKNLRYLIQEESSNVVYARGGQTIDFGGGSFFNILFPDRNTELLESNMASIVIQLIYGETKFIFTGDAPQSIEKYLVFIYKDFLNSDVLKVGHHGSKTSTSQIFVDSVNPRYAIISSGKNNRYGHPNKETLDILLESKVDIKNTADIGSISIVSDGEKVFFK